MQIIKTLIDMNLPEKLEALKLVADDLPVPIIVQSVLDHSVVYMNKVGLGILGVDLKEMQAINPREYVTRYFNIDDDKDYAEKINKRLQEMSENTTSFFQQVKSKDGTWELYASNTKVFMKNERGDVTHLVTTASPLDPEHHITIKINRLMDDVRFLRNNALVFGKLSVREVEVLKLMALGLSSSEIAEQLFIALATVETHRRNIRKKLSLKNNYDAVKFAHAFNLL
ncbi:MAG: helix-turn-helix transcriptional regulator [Pedobacter sp.]|uniref:helix-turn-helix transcriptional regulator n=1 Tax=Pedobacter sp. TaxID=1411316 RepID=UPI002806DD4C|nr:helix-turn-helix transcriptional regulator [Pedobacter sp.]MDQ8005806.1 helix-turn-helix transcriptional regulator [Pedobacter sp.]